MHDQHGNPEGHGGLKPRKVDFTDFKMERAFAFDPSLGEKGVITYTIPEPARISIKVLKAGTRELSLNPGDYLVSVQGDGGLSRSQSVQVRSGQVTTLQVQVDRRRRSLEMSIVE